MTTTGFIRRLIAGQPLLYAGNALCWILFHTWPLIPGLIAKAFFDHPGRPWFFAALAVAAGLARALVILAACLTGVPYRFRMQALLQGNLLARVLARPGARALPGSVGEAISTLRDDMEMTQGGVDLTFDALAGLLYTLGCVAVLLAVDWQVTLWVLLPIALVIGTAHAVRETAVQVREASRAATAQLTGAIGEAFGAVQAVRVAGAEERVAARLRRLSGARQAAVLRERRQSLTLEAVFGNTASLGAGLVLLVSAGKLAAGRFTVGDLALFSAYLIDVAGFTGFLGYLINTYRQAGVSFGRMVGLMQGAPAEALVARTKPLPPAPEPARLERLEVVGLSCGCLQDVSFTLERGSFTVITGRIGTGKTTLLRAVLGLLPAEGGEVRWNGEPVTRLEPPRAAYTAQVPGLLSGTVKENILLGLGAAPERLDRAIHSAVLDVDLATEVGARGVRLSGGQVQRTAAARMFVREAELFVCDDLSSALDAETESLLWQRTRERDATFLVVSNRPAALALADQVLVLEDGRLRQLAQSIDAGEKAM